METPSTPPPGPAPLQDPSEQQRRALIAHLTAILGAPAPPLPQRELDILAEAALGNTRQSRICQFLIFSLVGEKDPSGFEGHGFLELRALDRSLSDAFLTVLHWWRGPTQNDQPLYDVLQRLRNSASL